MAHGLGMYVGIPEGYKTYHMTGLCNKTLSKNFLPVFFSGANVSVSPPVNSTCTVVHGIAQNPANTGQVVDVVVRGFTHYFSNTTVTFFDTLVLNGSSGELAPIGNVTKHARLALGRAYLTVDNTNATKVGVCYFNPSNET